MKSTRCRSAWIWLAVAVMAVATVVRVEAAAARTTAYAHPVFEFFTGSPHSGPSATHRVPRYLRNWSDLSAGEWSTQQSSQAMLPVLFIGMIAPLSLVSARAMASAGRVPAAPALPSLFQRPPPAQRA